jgi:putative toxin-antitoxin system antitoxin component (TIGR02293 family)
MLGVSASQPSRWRRGEERPSFVASRRLLDLDHVLARALLLWEEPVARDWLESPNGYLNGARPIDVLMTRGSGEVTDALDAAQSGAFA